MKSSVTGKSTAKAEVTAITPNGVWLLANEKEYFLCFEQYPWFRNASVAAIMQIRQPHREHLCWPELDVDLEVASLENPEAYPLLFD